MKALATRKQVGAIHALKSRLGLDEPAYRAALAELGAASSKELSKAAAAALIDRFKHAPSPGSGLRLDSASPEAGEALARPPARGALRLDGPYAGVCRALWLSAWNLGLIRDRTDRAMSAFVARQTGIESLNWVRDPADGSKAIEGLKAWIARETRLAWPTERQAKQAGMTLSRARKLAIIAAQKRLLNCEAWGNPDGLSEADLDEAIAGFGRAIRAAKHEKE